MFYSFNRHKNKSLNLAQGQASITNQKIILQAEQKGTAVANYLRKKYEIETAAANHQLCQQLQTLKTKESKIQTQHELLGAALAKVDHNLSFYQARLAQTTEIATRAAGYSTDQAEDYLLMILTEKLKHRIADVIFLKQNQAIKKYLAEKTKIILDAIAAYAGSVTRETTTVTVKLKHDDDKGKIIGKEGRNIVAFEQATGTDLIIDETPKVVTLACFDPFRRQVACHTLTKLLGTGVIHPLSIAATTVSVTKRLTEDVMAIGRQVLGKFKIAEASDEITEMLGRLKYRTNHNQNMIVYSEQVAVTCDLIARQLNVDHRLALRSGLFHDLGKACKYNAIGSHAEIGAEIVARNHEPETVVSAVANHHHQFSKQSIYAVIVRVAITIVNLKFSESTTVPNIKPIKILPKITQACRDYPQVKQAYAFSACRKVWVILIIERMVVTDESFLKEEIEDKIIKKHVNSWETNISLISS